jgi:hypothetical protein
VAARNAFLSMMKLNIGNIGGRFRLGYITREQALQDGYTAADHQEAQKRVITAEKKWKNMGGNVAKFKEAALKGGTKKPKFTKDTGLTGWDSLDGFGTVLMVPESFEEYALDGLDTLGEPATASIIAAAGAALAAMLPILAGFKPKKKGAEQDAEETDASDKSFLKKVMDFGKKAIGKGKAVVNAVKGKRGDAAEAEEEEEEVDTASGSSFIGWALGLTAVAGIGYMVLKK